ncbi:MAG: hypothetical protein ACOC4G_14470, partial [Bacillota bacterium]
KLKRIEKSVKKICKYLSRHQYQYDLGDDIIIDRHGKIENSSLVVGNMNYDIVIVPEITVMRSSMFDLLKKFAHRGGIIILAGKAPYLLEGKESKRLKEFFQREFIINASNSLDDIGKLLMKNNSTRVELTEKSGKCPSDVYCHLRETEEKEIVFLCNLDKNKKYQLTFKIDNNYQVECWDQFTGERNQVKLLKGDNNYSFAFSLPPANSRLFIINKASQGTVKEKTEKGNEIVNKADEKIYIKPEDWQVIREDYNAVTLNKCQVKYNKNDQWCAPTNVVEMDDRLKEELGLEKGNIFSTQPWLYNTEELSETYSVQVKYDFYVEEELKGEIYIAAESPEIFTLYVNEKKVVPSEKYYKDRAFKLFDIKEEITEGSNEVILKTDEYGVTVNLESIYVVGEFKVFNNENDDFRMMPEKNFPTVGDWTETGYPFYSGKMTYKTNFYLNRDNYSKILLKFNKLWGCVFEVRINNTKAAVLGWEPFIIDVKEHIKQGDNNLELVVINSLQNLLGPYDYLEPEGLVTPGSFYSQKRIKFQKSGYSGEAVLKLWLS